MGSLALLARGLGHDVSGSDQNVYPPMSTQLADAGIALHEGYSVEGLFQHSPDLVIVGNAMSRGNAAIEALLESEVEFCSGPEWLARHVLRDRWVLAIAGTHGKTTTTSMLAWILEHAGLEPGFLIGGVPGNFAGSARLGGGKYFVIEADEYDTAFFDKRSKFVHYGPRTLVLNNLEFDHADIFADLAAIQTQFHHLLRTVPASGTVLLPAACEALSEVVEQGCWSALEYLPSLDAAASDRANWQITESNAECSSFTVCYGDPATAGAGDCAAISWSLQGVHNRANAVAAIAAAHKVGIPVAAAGEALNCFAGVKRRMELRATCGDIEVYDDFAHHPTAIASTLQACRLAHEADKAKGRLLAVVEPRSNTMRMGVHGNTLADAADTADRTWWYAPETSGFSISFDQGQGEHQSLLHNIDDIIAEVCAYAAAGDKIVIMSNGGFAGIHQRIIDQLEQKEKQA